MTDFRVFHLHRAAKPHCCAACNCTIQVGVIYARVCGYSDVDFWHDKLHEDCCAAWSAFVTELGCDPIDFSYDLLTELTRMTPFEAQNELDALRGFYPHVVARLELRLRPWFNDTYDDRAMA